MNVEADTPTLSTVEIAKKLSPLVGMTIAFKRKTEPGVVVTRVDSVVVQKHGSVLVSIYSPMGVQKFGSIEDFKNVLVFDKFNSKCELLYDLVENDIWF